MNKISAYRQYEPKKRSPLPPADVIKICDYMHHNGCQKEDLCSYVALLSAQFTGARSDSFQDIRIDDFETCQALWEVYRDVGVGSIVQRLCEKYDTKYVLYHIRFRDQVPKLCYLRHLLIFIHVCNIRKGYLFPAKTCLKDPKFFESGDYSSGNDCRAALGDLVVFIKKIIGLGIIDDSELIRIGLHTPRVMHYLWGLLAGASVEQLMRSARHLEYETAMGYYRDFKLIVERIMATPYLSRDNQVNPYYDPVIESVNDLYLRLIRSNQRLDHTPQKSLREIARQFVESRLGVKKTDAPYHNAGKLLNISYGLKLYVSERGLNDDELYTISRTVPQNHQMQVFFQLTAFLHRVLSSCQCTSCGSGHINSGVDPTSLPQLQQFAQRYTWHKIHPQKQSVQATLGESIATNNDAFYRYCATGQVPQQMKKQFRQDSGESAEEQQAKRPKYTPDCNAFVPVHDINTFKFRHLDVSKATTREYRVLETFSSQVSGWSAASQIGAVAEIVKEFMVIGKDDLLKGYGLSSNKYTKAPITSPTPVQQFQQGKYLCSTSDGKAKTMIHRKVRPFFRCFTEHCKWDLVVFQQTNPNFTTKNEILECMECRQHMASQPKHAGGRKKNT